MSATEAAGPLWEHDCKRCIYLGTDVQRADWYVCGPDEWRSLVRRQSSEPADYASGPVLGCVELTSFERRAAMMGFEFNTVELVRAGVRAVKAQCFEPREAFKRDAPAAQDATLFGDHGLFG